MFFFLQGIVIKHTQGACMFMHFYVVLGSIKVLFREETDFYETKLKLESFWFISDNWSSRDTTCHQIYSLGLLECQCNSLVSASVRHASEQILGLLFVKVCDAHESKWKPLHANLIIKTLIISTKCFIIEFSCRGLHLDSCPPETDCSLVCGIRYAKQCVLLTSEYASCIICEFNWAGTMRNKAETIKILQIFVILCDCKNL